MNVRLYSAAALASLVFLGACSNDDDSEGQSDRTAPVISAAEGRSAIRPEHKEVRSMTTDHMHVRFQVNDDSGISEVLVDIHHGFDGHTHGKTQGAFEHLSYRKIYDANGSKSLNIDSNFDDVYWAGNGSVIADNVLAGPYHFSIDAIDIHGNGTSSAANNNYSVTFFIERAYAPAIAITNLHDGELDGEKNEPLEVQGTIEKTTHALASDIAFVWIRLADEDDHHHKTNGDYHFEAKWGTSTYHNTSGDPLPSTTSLDFSAILSGSNAIILPNEHKHMELIIWVEDIEGNVVQKKYEVHVD